MTYFSESQSREAPRSDPPGERLLVYMTARDNAEADRLAEALVGSGLAAGVNILPGHSVYRWQGAVCRHAEAILLAQTTASRFAELEQVVRDLHSYEVPCVVALPLSHASAAFGHWIDTMTTIPPSSTEY